MKLINPYSFYDWWRSVTFPTWDPASPHNATWVLSNGNLTATTGDVAGGFSCVRATTPVKGVYSGKVRALEFKFNSVGPITGTKGIIAGIIADRTSSSVQDIAYQRGGPPQRTWTSAQPRWHRVAGPLSAPLLRLQATCSASRLT